MKPTATTTNGSLRPPTAPPAEQPAKERKHSLLKSCAAPIKNTSTFERSLLSSMLNSCLEDMKDTKLLALEFRSVWGRAPCRQQMIFGSGRALEGALSEFANETSMRPFYLWRTTAKGEGVISLSPLLRRLWRGTCREGAHSCMFL